MMMMMMMVLMVLMMRTMRLRLEAQSGGSVWRLRFELASLARCSLFSQAWRACSGAIYVCTAGARDSLHIHWGFISTHQSCVTAESSLQIGTPVDRGDLRRIRTGLLRQLVVSASLFRLVTGLQARYTGLVENRPPYTAPQLNHSLGNTHRGSTDLVAQWE